MPDDFTLLHADDALLVLDKPAGLLSVPGRGADKQDCLLARVQQRFPEALVVHRLDMATSGLLLMARHPSAQRRLGDAFAARAVHKRYEAIVAGLPPPPTSADGWGLIELPIAVDWPRRPLRVIDPLAGKPSATRWRVLAQDPALGRSRLALEPLSGRSHQLRVHLQALGHPIVGDALYAPPAVAALASRLLLHAAELRLPHPDTGQALCFTSPLPF